MMRRSIGRLLNSTLTRRNLRRVIEEIKVCLFSILNVVLSLRYDGTRKVRYMIHAMSGYNR